MGGGRGGLTSLNHLHLSKPTATAARLAWQAAGTTECDSREVKNWCHLISSHPPTSLARLACLACLGRTQQRTLPSVFAATPRSWSGAKESGDRPRSISCTSPAMVFHRQTSWPRAIRQDYWAGHRNVWSNLPLHPSSHTTHRTFEVFSSPPHLHRAQACLECANPPACSPRLGEDNKTLGRRHNNLSIQALSLTSKE